MHRVLGLLRAAELDGVVLALGKELFGRCFLFILCPWPPSHPLSVLYPFLFISPLQRASLEGSWSSITVPFYGKYAARERRRRGGFSEQQRAHEVGQDLNCLGLRCPQWRGRG